GSRGLPGLGRQSCRLLRPSSGQRRPARPGGCSAAAPGAADLLGAQAALRGPADRRGIDRPGRGLRPRPRRPVAQGVGSARDPAAAAGPGADPPTGPGGPVRGGRVPPVAGRARMEQSMSRPDNCYDNAFMESCFGTIKTELEMEVYADVQAASEEIHDYLCYYDAKRRHSSLGYLTPCEFELGQK